MSAVLASACEVPLSLPHTPSDVPTQDVHRLHECYLPAYQRPISSVCGGGFSADELLDVDSQDTFMS